MSHYQLELIPYSDLPVSSRHRIGPNDFVLFIEHVLEVEAQVQFLAFFMRFLSFCQAKRSPGCRSHFPISVYERSFKMLIVGPPATDTLTVYGKVYPRILPAK